MIPFNLTLGSSNTTDLSKFFQHSYKMMVVRLLAPSIYMLPEGRDNLLSPSTPVRGNTKQEQKCCSVFWLHGWWSGILLPRSGFLLNCRSRWLFLKCPCPFQAKVEDNRQQNNPPEQVSSKCIFLAHGSFSHKPILSSYLPTSKALDNNSLALPSAPILLKIRNNRIHCYQNLQELFS